MENASKALIMAGSVLISLLVISLIIIGYTQLSEYQQQVDDSEQVMTDTEYMQKIEQFDRTLYGSELLSLVNFVENYNSREAGDGYATIEFNVKITRSIDGGTEFNYFEAGDYNLDAIYDQVKGRNGIESKIEELEQPESKYNGKSVKYYWKKTYREIAQEFGLNIPSSTPSYDLENALIQAASANGQLSKIQDLLEEIKQYDLLNSIYTQFKEGKRFKPADDNGFVYDNLNGRVIEINFVEI